MRQKLKALFCWSGGKDSALALHKVLEDGDFEIVSLLTTLNETHRRISMHGVREDLLDKQAAAIGLPLTKVWVKEGSNTEYEQRMGEVLKRFKDEGVSHAIFGDIFLEDLRKYREDNLAKAGLQAYFPLWQQDTSKLMQEFIDRGFETITCCISTKYLDETFAGRKIDAAFIESLPAIADPCGENGEYHTFCYNGPIFHQAVPVQVGEKIFKPLTEYGIQEEGGFWFAELK